MHRALAVMLVCLLLPVGGAWAQGKSGKSPPRRSSVERSMGSQKSSERGPQAGAEHQSRSGETQQERGPSSGEEAGTQREAREEATRSERAASSDEGFFAGARRFFGFGRSEEASEGRVNESAQSRERARDQYRSPDDD